MPHARKVKILDVSPEITQRWLNEANNHNRPMRNHLVVKYAAAMKAGNWRLTSEPVAFSHPYIDSTGKNQAVTLLNGQHRLWAVIESGQTVPMTIWWGCEPEEFEVIDQGASRTFGDILATTRADLHDPVPVSIVVKNFARYGLGFERAHNRGRGITLQFDHIQIILREVEAEILAVVGHKKKLTRLAPRVALSALVMSQLINPGMTDLIVDQMHSAVGFTERDPIRALHVYLAERANSPLKESEAVMHYKICHAIAARLRGDHLRVLRITGEGLAWMREAARNRIHSLVAHLHGGTVPKNFYKPETRFTEAGEAA